MKEKWQFERDQEKNLKGESGTWEMIMNIAFIRDLMPLSSKCVQNVVTVFPMTSSLPQSQSFQGCREEKERMKWAEAM